MYGMQREFLGLPWAADEDRCNISHNAWMNGTNQLGHSRTV